MFRPLTDVEIKNIELENEKLAYEIEIERDKAETSALSVAREKRYEADNLAQPDRTRTLNFFSAVMPGTVDQAIETLQWWHERDPGEPITVNINTPGGSITDGLALYDTIMRMRRLGHHVTTRGMGMAASMGSVLLQAGDERIMDARSMLLIHEGSMSARGTDGQVEDMQKFKAMLTDELFEILAERSTMTKAQLRRKAKRKDWWLKADEALELGLCDKVE